AAGIRRIPADLRRPRFPSSSSRAEPLLAQQCKINTSCGIDRRRRYLIGGDGVICLGGSVVTSGPVPGMSWPLREGTDAHCGGTGHALRRAVPGSMKEEPDVTTSRSTAQLAAQARRDQAAAAGAANPAADPGG